MKNVLVLTILINLGIIGSLFGQLDLNFSTGINNSNCKFENFEGISSKGRMGYFIGVAPNLQISKRMHFQVDFQYSLKGYDAGIQSNILPSGFKYGYIDIIPEIELNVLNFLALGLGVNYGIKIDEQFKLEGEEWSNDDDFETVNATDFGLTGKLKINHKNIFLFARYNAGLKDIANVVFTDENGARIPGAKQLNRNIQLGIGYRFSI